MLVATTTSLHDSGLLAEILPAFETRSGTDVRVVAVGSGAALAMGARGDADLLLTHAPEGEKELVEQGLVLARVPFMVNHFVIAGPPSDPADVAGASRGSEALARIERASAPYVSRGDDSGTHRRERALLARAGLEPGAGWPGFASTGAGMGLTLQVAGERQAYTLSDLGTFLAFRERTGLVALSQPGPDLRNEYSVLRANPARFPEGQIQAEAALALESFLLEPATGTRIAAFGRERFGRSLFQPLRNPSTP
jgi:tungstate transport system substrate-binding protein